MLECVVNISEGRRANVIEAIALSAGLNLLDIHSDPDHNRSVLTLLGEDAPRAVARETVARLDLRRHSGVHPRIGVIDVVPFISLEGSSPSDAVNARDRFAYWVASELKVPVFIYGETGPTLPEVRRHSFGLLHPNFGPDLPHPTAGAVAVGARKVLVAYNLWLAEPDMTLARSIASHLRGPGVRTLALQVGDAVQVSMNLIEPLNVGPADVYDIVCEMAPIARAELVGLIPKAVLELIEPNRWDELDIGADRTIEARASRP
ncbi:MAG: glutamate formimidoyltransferase [Acidimicrobiales bacterium]